MRNGRKKCERVEYDEWRDEGRGMGIKRGEALKRTLLHELIRTREETFLSCISTSGELGTKGTRM